MSGTLAERLAAASRPDIDSKNKRRVTDGEPQGEAPQG
jgi:hypothetical protein